MPEVSIIIPAFNQGHYLAAAAQSALKQTVEDVEVIIVDDGSTDDTRAVACQLDDSRVVYIHQENRGLSGARNTGMRHATGNYLSFLDSDDLFLPEKCEILLQPFRDDPGLGLAAGQAQLINENGELIGKTFENALPDDPRLLLLGNPLHVGSVLLRRDWQEQVGFFDESLRSYEDWDFWLRLAQAGCPMTFVAKPVSLYRFHTGQMTRNGAQMTQASFAVLDKVFNNRQISHGWYLLKDEAYSNAHLRAAAHDYLALDFETGQENLRRAVELNPKLLQNQGLPLANRMTAWTELPKINDPLEFLETIYSHLPEDFEAMQKSRNKYLSKAAVDIAFREFRNESFENARKAALQAVAYRPTWLLNRGVLSILIQTALS